MSDRIGRNLALEIVRVTEAAALTSGRWMGRGDKEAADQAAVDAMRQMLDTIQMDGVVVIGEGEKDEAPMLYVGEKVGCADHPKVDIAVDPIDGTRLLALGMPNSISTVAMAERGALLESPYVMYMEKIVVGAAAADVIDIEAPVAVNLERVAEANDREVRDLVVVMLDRPRHEQFIHEVRAAGARLRLIPDGDVAGAVMAANVGTGIDMLLGIGGAPEAVVSACAVRCLGGGMQCRLWPRNDAEWALVKEHGIDVTRVLRLDDLAGGDDLFFAATGITDGDILRGVHYFRDGATTQSLVMRLRSGTVRKVDAVHRLNKLGQLEGMTFA
ncbi:MAG: class II fructose-bisphosphatase [Thermomicrobiales bacterium]|nr:class II fructose-bisphosphatase [Thermomicrobiales bacterium]